jgi:gentisate 1,2-dioxygenase
MRHGTTLTFEDLRRETAEALESADETQSAVAEALGVAPPQITKAKTTTGATYAALQRRILEHLTPYRVEEQPVTFKARRKTRTGAA